MEFSQIFTLSILLGAFLSGCNPLGSSEVASTGGSSTPAVIPGASCSLSAGVGTENIASTILTGYYGWDSTGTGITGSMSNRGTWNMTTTAFPGAGYFAGVSGSPALANICSTATFGGSSGLANCTTALPTLTTTGTLSWGVISAGSTKSLTFSIAASGSNLASLGFSGTGLSGFRVSSIAGRSVSTTPSAGSNVVVGLTNPGQTSTTVNFVPVYVDGSAKTMTVTVTDGNGTTSTVSADATYSNPIPGVSGLIAWYAADALALSNGAAVSSWTDSSSSANHAVQATAGNQPTFATNVINSQSAILFDGSDDYLSLTTRITTARTVFMVIRHATGTQGYAIVLGDTGGITFHGDAGTSLFSAFWGGPMNAAYSDGTSTALGSFTKSTTGQLATLVTSSSAAVSYISRDRNEPTRYWNGWIAEIVLYDTVLGASDISHIECYLGGKYGISLGHGC